MKRIDLRKMFLAAMVIAAGAFAQEIWDGSIDTDWYDDEESEFVITAAAQLAGLADLVLDGKQMDGKTITLGADIMLNDTTGWQDWSKDNAPENTTWIPIGSSTYGRQFLGTFDGAGHIVSGVYISSSSGSNIGFFGGTGYGAAIQNLGIIASYIMGRSNVGGLVGNLGSDITNCFFEGNIESIGGSDIGGLAGYSGYNNAITNCYAKGNVTGIYNQITEFYGIRNVGGLVGTSYSDITNCYFDGNVFSHDQSSSVVGTGGLAGRTLSGSITNCYATGNVGDNNQNTYIIGVGGLVGQNYRPITNSYSAGNLKTYNGIMGGLVGRNSASTANDPADVTNCYTVSTFASTPYNIGGLVGQNPNSAGYAVSVITSSYYDSETTGASDAGKGDGKETAELKTQETYEDWDFDDIWGIDANINDGYPYLRSMLIPATNIELSLPTIKYGDKLTLQSEVTPAVATNKTVVFSGQNIETDGEGKITFTKAGPVTVTATITQGRWFGFDYRQNFTLNVAKGDYDMSGVTFANSTQTHNGQSASIQISGELPAGVSVTYTGNGQSEVGTHTVTATFATTNDNYNVPAAMTAVLTIEAAAVEPIDPGDNTAITPTKSGKGLGIIFAKNVVSVSDNDKLEIAKVVISRDGNTEKLGQITKTVIYDNTGNVVSSEEGANARTWNLRNKSGRIVANGSYLVIVEANDGKGNYSEGKTYWYSAKIGVKK